MGTLASLIMLQAALKSVLLLCAELHLQLQDTAKNVKFECESYKWTSIPHTSSING